MQTYKSLPCMHLCSYSIRADMALRDIDYRTVQLNNLVVSLTVNEVRKHKLIIIKFEVNLAI